LDTGDDDDAAEFDFASAAAAGRSSESIHSSSSSSAAAKPERARRLPGATQFVDTYDGPPETPEVKARRVKKARADAAEARMAARKKAYQDALYAEIPPTTTPLGLKRTTPNGECYGGGNGSVEGSGDSSGGEPSYADEALTQHLQQLIPVMNKLQDVFAQLESARAMHALATTGDGSGSGGSSLGGVSGRSGRRRPRPRGSDHGGEEEGDAAEALSMDLPQIVVLGAQSSGALNGVRFFFGSQQHGEQRGKSREYSPQSKGPSQREARERQAVVCRIAFQGECGSSRF
jgi:hypothetical protein